MGGQWTAVPTPGRVRFEKSINVLGTEDVAGGNSLPAKMLIKMRDVR
jgi:hypothetical protein